MPQDERNAVVSEETEWFEYPPSWESAYRAKRGSHRYFAQYALMELLRQRHGVQALTWLHLASVDRQTKHRLASGEPWVPASPNPCRNDPRRTHRRAEKWNTMRQQMGAAFETLQQAIVSAKFGSYQGEPDLFCWTKGTWFFAEAKTLGESFLPSQNRWFSIARNLSGLDCKIFGCRLVAQGMRPEDQPQHTSQWSRMIKTMGARHNRALGTAEEFVKRVLGNSGDA
jgi:hypothetical protein